VTLAREHCPTCSEDNHVPADEQNEFAQPAMSRILQLAGAVSLFAIVIGGGVWFYIRSLKRAEAPAQMVFKCLFSVVLGAGTFLFDRHLIKMLQGDMLGDFVPAALMVGSVAISGIILSIMWAPQFGNFLCNPITNLMDGGNEEPEPKPYYSIARSLRMKGKFLEAVVEIRKQLARFPYDFEGVVLLAGIQAEDLQDLPGAEITLNHFCDRPDAPTKQVAAAMNHLADWQLKLAQDADSARAALEKIVMRFPDTELSLQAAQRIAHLDGAEKNLLAAHDRQPMAMPEGVKNIGLLESSDHLRPAEIDPAKLAADYVKHLAQHPLDTEVREKLAIVYADHYQRLDLATGELEQLIEEPNQRSKRVAHWLNLLADLQIRHGADYDTVRGTLEKIVERFPDLAVAEMARTRLGRLKIELKGHKETPDVKLGVYEQNIGLKYGSPRRL
jgi:tetratricopeptide (TPR) repeat protein